MHHHHNTYHNNNWNEQLIFNSLSYFSVKGLSSQSSQQQQRYILETVTMTTVTERQIMREADGAAQENQPNDNGDGGNDDDGTTAGGDNEDDHKVEQHESSIKRQPLPHGGSPISGILKGGRLWNKHQESGKTVQQPVENRQTQQVCIMLFSGGGGKR